MTGQAFTQNLENCPRHRLGRLDILASESEAGVGFLTMCLGPPGTR